MKKALSILLLVITIAYIMPVKYSAFTKDSFSLNTTENSCDDTPDVKKDNTKELFNTTNEQFTIAFTKPVGYISSPALLSFFCGFVETPPPDFL